jgi:diaminohydroxyphosphoribosylaminopyrimidine deaminase/5-amino-6-(5-phosphoribosylamino)uracil reductase
VQLSNADCERVTHENRLKNDVILTTAATVNQDNPQLNVRLAGKALSKPVAIIDRRLSLNPTSRIFNTASHCHIFYDKQLIAPVPVEHRTYHPVSSENGALCLPEVIQQLGRLGFHSAWVEAGGQLFNAMHEAHLVNRTHVYLVPRILGDEAVSAYNDLNILNQPQHIFWTSMGDNMIATLDWESLCSPV